LVVWSSDAILSKDLSGVISSWNHAAEQMFGYTAAEIIGRPITMLVPDDKRAEEAEVMRRIRSNERVERLVTIRQHKDGSLIPVSITVSPILNDAGMVIGASNITHDISVQLRNEADLADLRQRLIAVVSASSAILQSPALEDVQAATVATARELLTADGYALWRIDATSGGWRVVRAEGVSREFSSRMLDQPGVSSSLQAAVPFSEPVAVTDVLAEPMLAPQHEAYRAEGIRSMLVIPMTIGGLRSATLVFYFRSPHEFSSVEVQTGQALANVASAAISAAEQFDVAEHGKQQATFLEKAGALLASSLEYEQTLAAVADLAVPYVGDWCAVDIVGEAGQLKRLAIAHVDPEKLEFAKALQERYPEDPNAPGGVHQVIRTGQPTMMSAIPRELVVAAARDVEHLRLLDQLALTSYMCVPLVARGRTLGAITFLSAESGRHYGPADLQFAQELASRAALAIENARAYQQATDANRLKDDFLATLSHELRTPLNAVLGYARMLNMNVLDESKRGHAVIVIERNANALKQIIEDVLDVSRIVAGKLRLNVQPVHLHEIVKAAIGTVGPAADAKAIAIHSVLDAQVPPVSGDPDRLQQIVWNLLSNAVKFTPKGGRVQIELQRVNSHAEIVVSDTGRGIAPDFLPHLFERFRQADSAFSREHGGLGLGLAIVRELVELHGGTVHAASQGTGSGATFRVDLPLMIAHPPSAATRVHPRAEAALAQSVSHRLDDLTILAVDDEDDALGLLREILESAGAKVEVASSAEKALELIERVDPDVLIADVGMPSMDGFEFIKRVRRLSGDVRNVPAAALTAYARSQDRVTALASGFQMHIAKPVDPAELVVTVSALAGRPGNGSVS
jgi:PAS domain S-box-containing protein